MDAFTAQQLAPVAKNTESNHIWDLAWRNNQKSKRVKITDRFGNVTNYIGEGK